MQTTPERAGPAEFAPVLTGDGAGPQAGAVDFRMIAEKSLSLIIVADHTGSVQYVNPIFCEATGFTIDEVIGRRVQDLGQIDAETMVDLWNTLGFGRPWRGEFVASTKTGVELWVQSSISPITDASGKVTHFIAVNLDVTDRKRAEEALRQSEERFRTIVETTREVIWSTDVDSTILYVNPSVEAVLGYRPDELLGTNARDLLHPEDWSSMQDMYFEEFVAGRAGWADIVARWRHKDGRWRYVETSAGPLLGPGGDLVGFAGTCRDVTARQEAQEALSRSEERYRVLYQDNPSMYFTLAEDFTVLSVNQHGAEQLGYSPEELVGQPVFTVVHLDDQALVTRQLEALARRPGARHGMEFRKVRRDGAVMWVKENIRLSHDVDGRPIILVVCEDISERKQMEEAMQGLREDLEKKAERAVAGKNPYKLSFRELTVLHLVTGGRSDKEIGVILGIRPQTVSKHVANVLKKMHASSRTEAGVRALREGVIK
jgi:PAS domain S-box-containing protein